MRSYHLSRDLRDNEVLDFFTGLGKGLPTRYARDFGLDDHYEQACIWYDSTAGINATKHGEQSHGRKVGCHDLMNNDACASIWLTGNI